MRRRAGHGSIATWIAVLALVGGCSQPGTSPSPSLAAPTSSPAAVVTAGATPGPAAAAASPSASPTVAPLPSDLPPDIAYSIGKRLEFGLRADVDWVMATFADPRADRAFGFPMLPEEEAGLWARQARLDPVAGAVRRYAEAFDDTFAGMYLDQPNERVVSLWTTDLDHHQAALDAMVRAEGEVAVLPARWSLRELKAVQRQIGRSWDWFERIDAKPQGVGPSIKRNTVEIEISSANPDAPRLIAEHYARELGIDPEMIEAISDGTGVDLMPYERVEFVVVTADGDRPGPNDILVRTTPAAAGLCVPPGLASGEIPRSGAMTLLCTPGRWSIELRAPKPDAPHLNIYHLFASEFDTVGSAEFEVRRHEANRVRIRLLEGADIRH